MRLRGRQGEKSSPARSVLGSRGEAQRSNCRASRAHAIEGAGNRQRISPAPHGNYLGTSLRSPDKIPFPGPAPPQRPRVAKGRLIDERIFQRDSPYFEILCKQNSHRSPGARQQAALQRNRGLRNLPRLLPTARLHPSLLRRLARSLPPALPQFLKLRASCKPKRECARMSPCSSRQQSQSQDPVLASSGPGEEPVEPAFRAISLFQFPCARFNSGETKNQQLTRDCTTQ
jgi:hypothetical protein